MEGAAKKGKLSPKKRLPISECAGKLRGAELRCGAFDCSSL